MLIVASLVYKVYSFVCCVLDPPHPVMSLTSNQSCNDIITNWTASTTLTNQSCPITGYNVNMNVFGDTMSGTTDQTNYTLSVSDSFCNKTLEISVSAISGAGMSNPMSSNITVACTREYCTIIIYIYNIHVHTVLHEILFM